MDVNVGHVNGNCEVRWNYTLYDIKLLVNHHIDTWLTWYHKNDYVSPMVCSKRSALYVDYVTSYFKLLW